MSVPFLQGVLIGVSIAAPIGPVALLCMQRALVAGPCFGMATALGAVTAHAALGLVAMLGCVASADSLLAFETPWRIGSAVMLILIGGNALRKRSHATPASLPGSMVRAYLSTVLVALSNPLTVFPILALVTAAAAATATQVNAAVLIAGMLTGSSSWYGALVTGACLMRGGAGSALLGRLNRVFGLVLIAAGLSLLVRHLPAAA